LFIPALKSVQWNIVGKNHQNYILPFLISSLVAIVSNYLMNRASTFKGWKEQKGGFRRYMIMALATLVLDTALLFVFVRYGNFPYVPAAALAVLINFTVRFLIARSWVWKQRPAKIKSA
jgi:Na+-driven multidrug efflux pump